MIKEENLKEIPITIETSKIDVPKTGLEKKLRTKYNKLLKQMDTFDELQQLANDFKADLAVFLQKNRRYSFMILFFVNVSFGQTYVYSVKLSKVLTTTAASNPTLYKQNIFDLKECKDNSDALAKGLKVGMFYYLPMKDNISLIAVVRPPIIETKGTIENQTIYLSKEK